MLGPCERSTMRGLANGPTNEHRNGTIPFYASQQPGYFGLPSASHPLCRVLRNRDRIHGAPCFERLRDPSQLEQPGRIPNASQGCQTAPAPHWRRPPRFSDHCCLGLRLARGFFFSVFQRWRLRGELKNVFSWMGPPGIN